MPLPLTRLFQTSRVQHALKYSKPILRWGILGLTLAFLSHSLRDHWQEVAAVSLTGSQVTALGLALGITLVAHCWAGWVWGWILADLHHPRSPWWAMGTYLTTNLAKYLPGNIWHFYGRISQTQQQQIPLAAGITSVVLETLLMLTAALVLALGLGGAGREQGLILAIALTVVLTGIHPRFLNPVLTRMNRDKLKQWQRRFRRSTAETAETAAPHHGAETPAPALALATAPPPPASSRPLTRTWDDRSHTPPPVSPALDPGDPAPPSVPDSAYPAVSPSVSRPIPAEPQHTEHRHTEHRHINSEPSLPSQPTGLRSYLWKPLVGEFIFLGLRGLGFGVILVALTGADWSWGWRVLGSFSGAWLAGVVIPGAPGGLGVFEATALALLQGQSAQGLVLAPAGILVTLGFYRLVSTLAEAVGAAIGQWCLRRP